MNIWRGTDLAADILDSVKDAPGDRVAQVIVKSTDEPYYKGICADAKKCGVEIITAEKLVRNCAYPTISLNPDIRVPDAINLDGGYLMPCTAEATMRLLRHYGFDFQGADVLLLGRSERVGGPLSYLLTNTDATVTVAHSFTKKSSIHRLAKNADLIISSVGGHDFTELELKPTATVVDIGGDFVGVSGIQNYVPFIGGVGPVTRAILMEHILKFRRPMMQIDSTSICLNCAHLQTVTEDQYCGIERPIVLVECELEVYAFPCHNNQSCVYFKEKKMMTNIKNKKSEALSRMITLGLHPKVMQKFQDGGVTCSELTEDGTFLHREPTAEELESIGAFQKEHDCLVYYAIKTHANIGTMLALLYISDNVEEWTSDMLDIQAKTPMAYVINYDAQWCSEFGSIGVANVCGQLIRTE